MKMISRAIIVMAIVLLLFETAGAQVNKGGKGGGSGARGPCAKDIAAFCSDLPGGQGRIVQCLNGHLTAVSPGCQQFLGKMQQAIGQQHGQQSRSAFLRHHVNGEHQRDKNNVSATTIPVQGKVNSASTSLQSKGNTARTIQGNDGKQPSQGDGWLHPLGDKGVQQPSQDKGSQQWDTWMGQ